MKLLRKFKKYLRSAISVSYSAEKSKIARIPVILDIIYCSLRFHSTPQEYGLYRFYDFKNRYRKNFILNYHQRKRYGLVNNIEVTHSKRSFYKIMSKWFYREVIFVPECGEADFLAFVRKHKKVILKPDKGSLGKGIFVLYYESDEQVLQKFSLLTEPFICEEYISQHPIMAKLNPHTVNTLRIISIRNDANNVEIVSCILRMGAKANAVVDNIVSGGIFAQVDIDTGIVTSFAIDKSRNSYSHHPITNVQIIGMCVPNWDEVIKLVKQLHGAMDESRILALDIAVTEFGASVVEANSTPGTRSLQMIDCVPRGGKILKIINNKKFQIYKCPKT